MSKVSRSEKLLDNLGKRLGITEDGLTWLKTAIDPMHDSILKHVGFPDARGDASVPQFIKSSKTLTAPVPGSPWDLYIWDLPWLNNSGVGGQNLASFSTPAAESGIIVGTSQGGGGGLHYVACPAGHVMNSTDFILPPASGYVGDLAVDAIYLEGISRCTAKGFEVNNVSATLTNQGLCTVFRCPVPDFDTSSVNMYTGTAGGSAPNAGSCALSILDIPNVPLSVDDAMKLDGSRQWKAEAGCYVVSTFNSLNLATQSNNYTQPKMNFSTDTSAEGGFVGLPWGNGTGGAGFIGPQRFYWTNFNVSGCVFTGLDGTNALNLTYNVAIERFPNSTNKNLAVLASISPVLDNKALEVYSEIMASMPVAVRAAENGFGDWFAQAASKVASVVTPIARMIPHPGVQAAVLAHDTFTQPAGSSITGYNPQKTVAKMVTKAKNLQIKAKNDIIRAKNAEIRAKKDAKKK